MSKKTIDSYVSVVFPIECKGRDSAGHLALKDAIDVKVKIYKRPGGSDISSLVECSYNTGGHGQRCKASHPEVDKEGEGVICPYSFDLPYALDEFSSVVRMNATLKKKIRMAREKELYSRMPGISGGQ